MENKEFWDNFNLYDSIMEGLQEALAYERGEPNECRVTIRSTEDADYKAYLTSKAQAADSAVDRL